MSTANPALWAPIRYDAVHRLLEFATTDGAVSLLTGPSLVADGQELHLEEATLESPSQADGGELLIRYWKAPVVLSLRVARSAEARTLTLQATLRNEGSDPVALGECRLLDVSPRRGQVRLAGDDGDAVYLKSMGATGPARVHRCREGEGFARTLLHLVSHAAGRALTLGFVTFDHQTTHHRFQYEASGLAGLQSVCDFEGWAFGSVGAVVRSGRQAGDRRIATRRRTR